MSRLVRRNLGDRKVGEVIQRLQPADVSSGVLAFTGYFFTTNR